MDGECDDAGIGKRVCDWKSHICRVIRPSSILRWMPNFFSQVDIQHIESTEQNRSPSLAALVFLNKLEKSTEPGKWTAFKHALVLSDYPYLANLLSSDGQTPENSLHQRRMLQIFAPYLDILEPIDIMIHLTATDLINSEDKEEIVACHETQGSIAATMLMLDRIQRRQAPSVWYTEFLRVLSQRGYSDIVKEMEPEFVVDSDVLKVVPSIVLPDLSESEEEGQSTTTSLIEDAIKYRVFSLKSQISEMVSVEKLLPSICSLISIDRVCQMIRRDNSSRKEAFEAVLEDVSKSRCRTKWQKFVDCLKEADYPYVAEVLKRPTMKPNLQMERNVLNVFATTIGQQLDPISLMPYLEEEGVINKHDKYEITAAYNKSGTMAASFVLLECMQCRKAPSEWYKMFLQSLIKSDQSELAKTIDPEYTKKLNDNTGNSTDVVMGCKDAVLDNALEEAYVHIYNEQKSNERTISSIRKHYQSLEQALVNKNEEVYHDKIKRLNDLENKVERLANNSNENEWSNILKHITAVSSQCNEVIVDSHFMTNKQIGTVEVTESSGSISNGIFNNQRRCDDDNQSTVSSGFEEVVGPMSPNELIIKFIDSISSVSSTDGSLCSPIDRLLLSTKDEKQSGQVHSGKGHQDSHSRNPQVIETWLMYSLGPNGSF